MFQVVIFLHNIEDAADSYIFQSNNGLIYSVESTASSPPLQTAVTAAPTTTHYDVSAPSMPLAPSKTKKVCLMSDLMVYCMYDRISCTLLCM